MDCLPVSRRRLFQWTASVGFAGVAPVERVLGEQWSRGEGIGIGAGTGTGTGAGAASDNTAIQTRDAHPADGAAGPGEGGSNPGRSLGAGQAPAEGVSAAGSAPSDPDGPHPDGTDAALNAGARWLTLIETHVAGTAYYQAALMAGCLHSDGRLVLRREPQNPHDTRAIEVFTSDGVKLGYVPRIRNSPFAALMDDGQSLQARVAAVRHWSDIRFTIDLRLPA